MKKTYFIILLTVLVAILIACLIKKDVSKSVFFGTNDNACFTTITKICNDPDSYQDKTVIFEGYLYAGFEIEGIYPKSGNVREQTGICVNLTQIINILGDSIPKSVAYKTRGTKVLVMGKYKAGETGHMGSCCGELININCLILY